MSFKSGVKGQGSDRCQNEGGDCWGDMRRMRWTRRRVNRMRLTESRRELKERLVICDEEDTVIQMVELG